MRKSRLEWTVQKRLIEHFVSGSTARTAASLVGVNKSTAAFYFQRLREIIAQQSEDGSPLFGEIEVDESYFGGHRKGKRGRGAAGKVPVFGLLKRGGKVYAKVPQREGTDPEGHHGRQDRARQHRLYRHPELV
jgi:transposase